jgi:negative regulator of flagellin synthesis FlgM
MKIGQPREQPVGTPIATEAKTRAKSDATADAAGTTRSAASAKVQLSDAASGLLAVGPASEVFDAAKVERLAEAIAQGKFVVNPAAVADKLIASSRELLSKTAR